jgi:hypothetical protein
MSHGPSLKAVYRQLGVWAALLMKDPKLLPHKLPPAKLLQTELVINNATENALVAANKIKQFRLNKLKDMADELI